MNTRKLHRKARKAQPLMEQLESRQLRSVTLYTASGVPGLLELKGSSASDFFELQMTDANTVEVRITAAKSGVLGSGVSFKTADIKNVAAYLYESNDTLQVLDGYMGAPLFDKPMYVIADNPANKAGGNNDIIKTGNGADTIYGYGGDDTIYTKGGNDTIYGYDAPGTYSSTSFYQDYDHIWAGDGLDTVYGGPADDEIYGEGSNDLLYGHEGNDTISGGDSNDTIFGATGDDKIDPGSGDDYVYCDAGNDTVLGSSGNDAIYGDSGNDYIFGGDGNDTILSNGGNDYISAGEGDDQISAAAGNDTIYASGGNDVVAAGSGNDIVWGGSGNDQIDGEDGIDVLRGEDGNDTLKGGTGNDTLYGMNGDDRLYGDDNDDYVSGGDGNDNLFAGSGTDWLDGGNGDDILVSIDDDHYDNLYGQTGFDSFWVDRTSPWPSKHTDTTDADTNEAETNLHEVEGFENGADLSLNGDIITDPVGGSAFSNYAAKPLFSTAGPVVEDVKQGHLADCWLMATLAEASHINQNIIRQLVADLGDGTYVVQINQKQYRVDADLAYDNSNTADLYYANFGVDDSIWVAIVEKAWALYLDGTYDSLNDNNAYFAMGKIGGEDRALWNPWGNSKTILSSIDSGGLAAVAFSKTDASKVSVLTDSHCHAIIDVFYDSKGEVSSVLLYNPYGKDGTTRSDGADDGYITLTVDEFEHDIQDIGGVTSADFSRYS